MILNEPDMNRLPETGTGFIYALCEPVSMEVRYIGQTKRSLRIRLKDHIRCAIGKRREGKIKSPVYRWITDLCMEGLEPKIKLLEIVDISGMDAAEIKYIIEGREKYRLLNATTRGNIGGIKKGHKFTDKQCQEKRGSGNNAFVNYVGTWFNQLVVTGFVGVKDNKSYWSCICDCGNSIIISVNRLFNQKSCGCARKTRWDDEAKDKFKEYVNKNRKKSPDGRFAKNIQ